MKGWITLHRKIEENDLWLSEPFTKGQAWVDLLLLANHKDKVIWKRGIKMTIKRGEVGWSETALATRWKWSREKVRNFLKYLKTVQQIDREVNHTLSRIIVLNYDKYQSDRTTDRTTDQTNNNNDNNDNNINSEADASLDTCMPFNKYSDDYEGPPIDAETGKPLVDHQAIEKTKERELNEKIRHNLRLVEQARGLPFGIGKDMAYHVKIYRQLLNAGWSHDSLIAALLETINTDYWKEQKKIGHYPGMNTVQSLLRNKQPK